ncbi:beta-lactamase family protein [Micromonospora sp. STR1s_5]|nr:beta-lactamase family protein [Micromonospora sp. STR1s_5]
MRRTTVTVLVVALIAGLVGVALMPQVPRLGAQATGDRDLAAAARSATPDPSGLRGLAVALVENGRIRTAGLGDRDLAGRPVEPGTPFEIGSVTKALTGMLLADQVAAGASAPTDRLGSTWPEVTGPARDVTLAELASHRAGLPRLAPGSPLGWARILWSNVSGGNPYAEQGVDAVRSAADRVSIDDDERGEVHYSNLGPSVLGHALATKAGVAYPELLHDRLLRPLGMTATIVAIHDDDLPADRAQGSRAGGRPLDPWAGAGYAPAGAGPWSTAEDLGRLLAAVLAGTAPGAGAPPPATARTTTPASGTAGSPPGTAIARWSGTTALPAGSGPTSASNRRPAGRWWCSATPTRASSRSGCGCSGCHRRRPTRRHRWCCRGSAPASLWPSPSSGASPCSAPPAVANWTR